MRRGIVTCFAIGVLATTGLAAEAGGGRSARVEAFLNTSALQPGQQTAIAVVIDIPRGFHAQSHTPASPDFIALNVTLKDQAATKLWPAIYPAGEKQVSEKLGQLDVYVGRVIIYVPVELKGDAPAGPVRISGSVEYQMCDDASCFAPEDKPFAVETQLVARGQGVKAANAELFKDFDPAVFAHGPATTQAAAPAPRSEAGAAPHWPYPLALGIAFLAGLLFNVMPCVLPVLPLKAIGFYETAQHSRVKSMLLGVVFSAGIISLFAVLSILILVTRTIDWSELFAIPWVAYIVAGILLVMGLGMFGAFSVNLPGGVYRLAPRHDTYTGNFLYGGFTAFLSTPCTAPLFPALLVYALALPVYQRVPVMLTVGVGMSSPYLVLSAFPQMARRFPRTGPWADLVKHMLGFMLFGVAIYFAGSHLLPHNQHLWALVGVAAAAGIYLMVRTLSHTRWPVGVAIAALLAVGLFGGVLGWTLSVTGRSATVWVEFTPERLAAARQSKKTVLVDFTASWCGNCQYIEATVFRDQRVLDALNQAGVVRLRADLTRRSAAGWPLLKQLNPGGGIPLTAIWGPGRAEPVELESVYGSDELLAAVGRVKG